jgi:hypothetical protein
MAQEDPSFSGLKCPWSDDVLTIGDYPTRLRHTTRESDHQNVRKYSNHTALSQFAIHVFISLFVVAQRYVEIKINFSFITHFFFLRPECAFQDVYIEDHPACRPLSSLRLNTVVECSRSACYKCPFLPFLGTCKLRIRYVK